MSKLSFLPGNSQKPPEQNRLGAAETPIIAEEIIDGDHTVATMYDLVLRMQMSKAAIQGTQTSYESEQTAQLIDATARFQARTATVYGPQQMGDTHVQEAA